MSYSKYTILLQNTNILAFIWLIIVNALANTLALNGKTTGEISNLYPTQVTPAGYVFSIWGLIYALLLIFVIFQVLPSQRDKPFLWQVSFLFALSCVFNISWLFLWHYGQIVLSVLPMFGLLATLIAIYLRLNIGKANVPIKERIYVHLPFSVYLGWITVASITNVAAALVSINWDGWGLSDIYWGVIMIAIAAIITLAVIATRRDIAYSLVIVWALAGIAAKQGVNSTVLTAAAAGAVIIAIALVVVNVAVRLRR